ncbi:MAG: iron ABC transporter permease [Bryobacteraceae bacterium]|nr:iron ABC transporter permease [Bryobacteraceae bacterium]
MTPEPAAARRLGRTVAWGALAAIAALALLPLIGSTSIDYGSALRGVSPDKEILFSFRLPRVLLAMVVGGGLAVSGVLFQALVRDALADPYVLGVAGGAALGAVLAIVFGWTGVGGFSGVWLSASAGAGAVLLLVLAIASHGRRMSSFTLLLAGITMNSVCAAVLLFLHNLVDFQQSFAVLRWLMGGIEPNTYSTIGWLALVVLSAVGFVFWRARQWNLLAVGEEWATARGLSATRLMVTGFIAGSLITGSVTAVTGPIGFIGLIVPHALRLRLGADHRLLIPGAFLAGAVFLAVCDTVARTALAPSEVPVGVITALLGGPFFIWLLRSKKRSLWL